MYCAQDSSANSIPTPRRNSTFAALVVYHPKRSTRIDWTAAALISAALFAGLNITDKVIMTTLGLRARAFLLFIGFQTLTTFAVIAVVNQYPSLPFEIWLKGIGVGIFWGFGAWLILWSLSRDEVSRVTPISQSYPLLTVIFAVVLLGEPLSALESAAVVLTALGAVLAALKFSGGSQPITLSGTFGYLLIAVLMLAGGQTLLKTITDDVSFWHALGLRGAGMAIVLLPMNFRGEIASELLGFVRKPRALVALTIDVGLATAALALLTFAIATGPLSLTSAISGSTPLVVFFATVLLAKKFPQLLGETLTARLITQKLIAAMLVVTGLTIIALA
jgi:drug/metabolite transporter (DMT)-like permease